MKPINRLIIVKYNILKVGFDFMGYRVTDQSKISIHHFDKRCNGGKDDLSNCCAIMREPHDYLHIIEGIDRSKYNAINEQMMIENRLGKLDIDCMRRIDEILCEFEDKHSDDCTKSGKLLILDSYKERYFRESA